MGEQFNGHWIGDSSADKLTRALGRKASDQFEGLSSSVTSKAFKKAGDFKGGVSVKAIARRA